MRPHVQEYVLRCGQFYLGPKHASRVSSFERAVRFNEREAAEKCAVILRGGGVFQLPWTVVPIPDCGPESEAA
jgi:hypothetical protein